MADRSVTVRLAANVSGFTGPMGAASASANGLNKSLDKQGTTAATSTTQMGKLQTATGAAGSGFSAMGLGAGVAGAAVGKLAMDSVRAASDLAESQNKVAVVFGESSDEIRDFGETAADSFGMSENAALSAASGFGQFFDAAGMSEQASVDMSTELVKLAADLASFNNIGTDEALEKLRSGLAGEAEPMRALGVFLSEAAVKAKAMELGLVGANGKLTEGAKIQARYALIMEQTTKAQGDFARTSDGVANKTRIMNAEFEDAKAKLGEGLIPALSQATDVAIEATDALGPLVTGLGQLQTRLDEEGRTFADLIPGVREARDAWDFWAGTVGLASDKTDESAVSMKEQQRIMDSQTLATYEARDASGVFAEKTAETQEAIEAEAKALEDLRDQYFDTMNAALGLSDATIDYEQAIDDATETIGEINKGTEGFAKTLDINTQAGRDNQAALDDIASAALGVQNQMYATGASEADVTAKNATMRASLYEAARQFGLTEQEALDYTNRVLGIPPQANTTANFEDTDARTKIQAFLKYLGGAIPSSVPLSIRATGSGGTGGPSSAGIAAGSRVFPLPGGKARWPVTQGLHPINAIDYGAPTGTPIFASFSGQLSTADAGGRSYGKFYRLSGSGQPILGAHLSGFARGSGPIAQGQLIGWTGATGNATGPHLHLENFDTGGILGHGGVARNMSGRPERVLNPAQTESFDKLVTVLAGGRNAGATYVVNVHVSGSVTAERELARTIKDELNRFSRRGDVFST